MATTYKMNNEELITVYDDSEIPGIIGEKLSWELAQYLENKLHTHNEAEIYAKEKLNTDLDNYEEQLFEYHSELEDTANVISSIIYNMKTVSRINKAKILSDLQLLEDEIRSYL